VKTTTAVPARTRGERFETFVLVVILLTVGGFAGAASFTHVHDWTMTNSPDDTGSWFGWANAVVSELVPIAALLVMRRRRRLAQPIAYPASLLVGALVLSITAQLAVAKPTIFGGIVSVVPALAFAALAKLVLGKAPAYTEDAPALVPSPAVPVPAPSAVPADVPTTPAPVTPARPNATQTYLAASRPSTPPASSSAVPSAPAPALQRSSWPSPALPGDLLDRARSVAADHLQRTGTPITRDELRALLRVSNATTGDVMRALGLAPSRTVPAVPAAVNGHAVPAVADGLF